MSLIAIVPLIILKPKPTKVHKRLDISQIKGFFTKTNIAFLIYTGVVGLGAGLVVPFFGVYLKYVLDTSDSIVGAILSFAQLGTVFGGLSVPFLSERIGPYKTIIVTQLLSFPMLIAIGFPQGIIVMAIAFFLRSSLMNMGQPLIRNISMNLVTEIHRPFMSAMRAMVNNITRAIGIYIGGFLMARFTYNTPYAFTIMLYLLGTFMFYNIFKDNIGKKIDLK